MKHLHVGLSLSLSVALLVGCKTALSPLPEHSAASVAQAKQPLSFSPQIQQAVPRDGQANVRVNLRVRESTAPGFKVLSLPSVWTEAVVSLYSPTANTAYNATHHTRSVAFGSFTDNTNVDVSTVAVVSSPQGSAVDSAGNLYVVDFNNHRIRKIATNGDVTTFAGSGTEGYADGNGTSAQFRMPQGIAIDSSDNVYVADTYNHRIRKIDTDGNVSTVAGSGIRGYYNANGTSARFDVPRGVAVDSSGNLYVADIENNRIRKIDTSGNVTTLAGSSWGYADGNGTSARFHQPHGVAVDSSGNVYVADLVNNRIRKIDTNGNVTTVAGSSWGYADGNGTSARFNQPKGVAVDSSGNLYVADTYNHRIRKIDTSGNVTTIAGSTAGYLDANGTSARFRYPRGVALGPDGNVYVADESNARIRKISIDASYMSSFSFPPLRPATDYEGRVYLKSAAGTIQTNRLAGSKVASGLTLSAGANTIEFDVTFNGNEATYQVNTSANGNVVTGNNITKDDVVTLATGVAASQPGVAKVEVRLSGDCYGSPADPVLVTTLTDAASWNSFSWDTGADSGDYLAATLTGGTGTSTLDGQLDFLAYNDRNELVGKGSVAIHVFGRPEIDIRLK